MPFDVFYCFGLPGENAFGLATVGFSSAFPHRIMIFRLAISSAAWLLATAMHLVHSCPRSALSLLVGHAAFLVAFLDVLGLPLLLIRVFGFVPAWHPILHEMN
jgi:hypothetical protein